jgi:dTDP-4-dehydrorhamnose reductase
MQDGIDAPITLRRVLLLGGSGLLGAAFSRVLARAGLEVVAPSSRAADVRDLASLVAAVRDGAPDLVVNSSALSKVDRAEVEPELAFAVNALGAHNAALAAAGAGVPLVHVSSDYVFDGSRRTPYREFDPTGLPPNVYGCSKLEGEILVRQAWPRHFIVRVAALFGEGGRADFVDWVLAGARPEKPLTIVADRSTSPTWTDDAARQILALARTPFYGTYHTCSHGVASWFELAREVLRLAGRERDGVVPIIDAELRCPARRAPFTALENHRLRMRGLDGMMSWREGLAAHLASRSRPAEGPGRS